MEETIAGLGWTYPSDFFFVWVDSFLPLDPSSSFSVEFSGGWRFDLDKISGALYITWSFLFDVAAGTNNP
jgi:hypothetical protein